MTRFVSRRSGISGVLAACALLLLPPSPLLAHTRLLSSSPKSGEALAVSPAAIRLVFSEAPMMGVTRIVLTGPAGDTIALEPAAVDSMGAHAISARLNNSLTGGTYTVHWVASGRDGHVERGSFSFTVLGPSAAAVDSNPRSVGSNRHPFAETAPPDDVALSQPFTIARWIGFLALFCVIGAIAFKLFVLPRAGWVTDAGDPFADIGSVGAATYGLIASVAHTLATVMKMYGESLAMHDVPPEAILMTTGWGWAWGVQMLACLLAIVGFAVAHRGTKRGWSLAALAAGFLVVTHAATGHAIGSDKAMFAVPLDVLHVLAGSTWLGTLSVILIVGIGAAAKTPGTVPLGARVAAMINAFSPLALVCGATMVATGVAASLLHLEPLSSLWTSSYGRMLIVKLAFVALLFVVGAWNWRRVRPSLGGDEGVRALRFSAKLELTIAGMVLMVTAFLVALPLPE